MHRRKGGLRGKEVRLHLVARKYTSDLAKHFVDIGPTTAIYLEEGVCGCSCRYHRDPRRGGPNTGRSTYLGVPDAHNVGAYETPEGSGSVAAQKAA